MSTLNLTPLLAVDTWMADEVMPNVTGNGFKIVYAITRAVLQGVKKITYRYLAEKCGIASLESVSRALQEVMEKGFVEYFGRGRKKFLITKTARENLPIVEKLATPTTGFVTETVTTSLGMANHVTETVTKCDLVTPNPVTETVTNGSPSTTYLVTETVTNAPNNNNLTNTYSKEIVITGDAVHEVSQHFQSVWGVFPNPGTWERNWEMPIKAWLNGHCTQDQVKERIDRATEVARGNNGLNKRYRVTSPISLASIMANLDTDDTAAAIVQAIDDNSTWMLVMQWINRAKPFAELPDMIQARIRSFGENRLRRATTNDLPFMKREFMAGLAAA